MPSFRKVIKIRKILFIVVLFSLVNTGFSASQQDTSAFDRTILGRPFELEEFLQKAGSHTYPSTENGIPDWVVSGEVQPDTFYYGIGESQVSSTAADDEARLQFAQYVEVSVRSIATQQIAENKDRLEIDYSYQSLVSTNMNLRSVKITERYLSSDSTFYSLIRYGKSEYHDLVTREIQVSLEAEIRKQELRHQAAVIMSADSLHHKQLMDSLALRRKQAVIDSLDSVLKMEQSRQRQAQDRINLIKKHYAAFLKINPNYQLIDVPTASTPDVWVYTSGRWNPETNRIRQAQIGISIWLLTVEANLWAKQLILDQGDMSVRLEVLPKQGELYPVSLALGYLGYISQFSESAQFNFRDISDGSRIRRWGKDLGEDWLDEDIRKSTFFVTGFVGIPQINSHLSIYLDQNRGSFAQIWYPFPRNLGNAVSIINQFDVIRSKSYRNRFNDKFQWQFGLRLIAIPDRFATMISYEDHEVWMLNFELQY